MNPLKSEFESPLPHRINALKPVPVAGFIFERKNFAKTLPQVSRIYHYRKPRLVKGKQGWYITYQYRIPVDVRHLYDDKEWYTFKIRDDINRRKGADKTALAEWLLHEITESLKNGYNPFNPELEYVQDEIAGIEKPDGEMNITDALNLFLEKWRSRGLDPVTVARYERYVNRLISWLQYKRIPYREARLITTDHIEAFLSDTKKDLGYGNREYNNTLDFIRTAFNFMVKKKIIDDNPCSDIDKQKAPVSKHRFYNDESLDTITKALKLIDPYTYFAFQAVYYLCVRAEKELQNLKVGNIKWEQNIILAEAEGTKGSAARYIPMDAHIKEIFLQRGIDKFPPEYYVFGVNGKPAAQPFGRTFFSKRFKKARDKAGLDPLYSLYSAKHTRVINLKQKGLSDADIMALTGHKDFTSYAKYLRDLGLDANPDRINEVSRKI